MNQEVFVKAFFDELAKLAALAKTIEPTLIRTEADPFGAHGRGFQVQSGRGRTQQVGVKPKGLLKGKKRFWRPK